MFERKLIIQVQRGRYSIGFIGSDLINSDNYAEYKHSHKIGMRKRRKSERRDVEKGSLAIACSKR